MVQFGKRPKSSRYPLNTQIEFEEEPCTVDQACAHLVLTAPDGVVVMAKARGPRGGWPWVRFVMAEEARCLQPGRRNTLHIGRIIWTANR